MTFWGPKANKGRLTTTTRNQDLYWTGRDPSQDRRQRPVHPGVGERQGPHWCTRGDVCEGCERCLTPSAWEHFRRIGEAQEAKNQLHLVVRFLERQAEEKLGLTRELYTHHCNHPKLDPPLSQLVEWRENPRQLLLQSLLGKPQPTGAPSDL